MIATLARHKLILIVVAIIIAGIAWYALSGGTPSSSSDLTSAAPTASANPADQDLVNTLLTLRTVQLDGTIFTDPAFMSLKDFSTQIVPEPVGRTDPFAPLSAAAAPSASSTRSAQIFTPRQ
jgi:hypothetical protein